MNGCDCVHKINESLKQQFGGDASLDIAINFTGGAAYPEMHATYTPEGRKTKKTVLVQPTYCPFCGVKYEEGV